MVISSWQDQIIKGSLLGNGYIPKKIPRKYLGITETKDFNWLKYKGLELESLQALTPISIIGKHGKWRSTSGEIWLKYQEMFYYEDRKYVTMETMDSLRDIALAVWFGDKGFWYSHYLIGLRTPAFKEYNQVFWKYFNEIGLSCNIKTDSFGVTRIIFDRIGTNKFLATIAHRLPDFMHYKLKSSFLKQLCQYH